MTLRKALPLLVLGILGSATARADIETCSFDVDKPDGTPTYDVQLVEYFHAPFSQSTRCTVGEPCSFSGWLVSKHDLPAGKQPAIIFEHGSEGGAPGFVPVEDDQSLTSYSCPIKGFVDAGYVVFMAYRRGTVDKTFLSTLPQAARGHGWLGFTNTGWAANAWAISKVQSQGVAMNIDNYTGQYIAYLDEEVDDLRFAINKLDSVMRRDASGKLVDPTRIAIAGHSIGGAFTTFAGSDDDLYDPAIVPNGPRAFISLSGAAMSYHESHWWHDVLTGAAAVNNAPLTFTRAKDESPELDFASATEPFDAITSFPLKSGEILLPAVNATCAPTNPPTSWWQCNHAAFVTNAAQIAKWLPFVLGRLNAAGM